MASKKQSEKNISTETDQTPSGSIPTSAVDDEHPQFDEVIAGIFCSKRRTGQFDDRFETGELEFHQVFNTNPVAVEAKPETTQLVDNWDDCVVHDLEKHEFDTMDNLMEWPADFDESSDQF